MGSDNLGQMKTGETADVVKNDKELGVQQVDAATGSMVKADSSTKRIRCQGESRADVLYILDVTDRSGNRKGFIKDTPWKGVRGNFGKDTTSDVDGGQAVLGYRIALRVEKISQKEGNTIETWREQPVDFEVGRDVVLHGTEWPSIQIYSQDLVRVMEALLEYYPSHRGYYDKFDSAAEDTIVEMMHYYGELKAYLRSYTENTSADELRDSNLDIPSCGDEEIAAKRDKYLTFGTLAVEKEPCTKKTAHDLAVLVRLLAPMYRAKVVPSLVSVLNQPEPVITYGGLWILAKPGTLVYCKNTRRPSVNKLPSVNSPLRRQQHLEERLPEPPASDPLAFVVASWEYRLRNPRSKDPEELRDRIEFILWAIEYDGGFKRVPYVATIATFPAFRPVRDLNVVPATIYDELDGGNLRRKLEKRGRKYLSLVSEVAAHREYEDSRTGYSGQVIVDPEAYSQRVTTDDDTQPIADGGSSKYQYLRDCEPSRIHESDNFLEVCCLLPRCVGGLGLKEKRWMMMDVDMISHDPPAFTPNQLDDELVLVSDADKDALRAVLPRGIHPISSVSDFVQGKGEGQVFFLYGPPGTGKTLTVECVANDASRPLISLTASDISTRPHPHSMESQLRDWFKIAAKWDAVLLIDEADIFLEQRREGDYYRNTVASVFLRTMEYYKGVLFLTSNRPGHIDDSFISRITTPIAYHELSVESKRKVGKKLIQKFEATGTVEMEAAAEKYLIDNCEELNGRQIRNVLHNAITNAETDLYLSRQRAAAAAVGRVGTTCGVSQQQHGAAVESSKTHHGEAAPMNGRNAATVVVKRQYIKAAIERQLDFKGYLTALRGGRDESARAKAKRDYLSAQD